MTLPGCAYRLYAPSPPAEERIRIMAKSADLFAIRINAGYLTDYPVPRDGRGTLTIPGERPSCGVYLFNVIKVGGGKYRKQASVITLTENGKTVREFSMKQTVALDTDSAGYRLFYKRGCQEHFSPYAGGADFLRGIQSLSP